MFPTSPDNVPNSLPVDHFSVPNLKKRMGTGRNLNHSATRSLYRSIVADLSADSMLKNDLLDESERAAACSVMRYQVRTYSRSRDSGSFLTDVALQIRDSYVHALRYLPLSLRMDFIDSHSYTLKHSRLLLEEAWNCLAPQLSGGQCPSYEFLRTIRGKTDAEILHSCTKVNEGYNF